MTALLAIAASSSADTPTFNRDVRPILSDLCFACHGPDAKSREADLRLDMLDEALTQGAIVRGDSGASKIMKRILSSTDDERMPPPATGKKLTSEQIHTLRSWIDAGAPYESHWAFERVPPTVVTPRLTPPSDWPRQDLDVFVLDAIRSHHFTPASAATKEQWLRRVTLDLTGLPPSVDQLNAFLADHRESAYVRVVDRLLADESFGERMASIWLDVARYADTFGYQNDVAMEVWPWRDWVIQAFNNNLPYDQFITWQIAGDLLPNPTRDQQLATTFNRLHRQTNEGGSIPEEFRQAGIADRTSTVGTAMLGLTLDCSRCHDHKYDPITQRDFYRLAACFSNIDELGVYAHFTFAAPTPAMLLYEGDQEAQHMAAKEEVIRQHQELRHYIDETHNAILSNHDSLLVSLPEPPKPDWSEPLEGDVPGIVGQATKCNGDDEIQCKVAPQLSRTTPFSLSLWVYPAIHQPRTVVLHQSVAAEDSAFRGLQLTLDSGLPEFSLIHFWPGDAIRVKATGAIPLSEWTHLAVTYDGSSQAEGVRLFVNGAAVETRVERDQLTRDILHLAAWHDMNVGNVRLSLGARFRDFGFREGKLDDLQVFTRQVTGAEIAAIYAGVKSDAGQIELTDAMRLEHYRLTQDTEFLKRQDQLRAARERENEIVTGVRQIMTMKTAEVPRQSFILKRGAYDEPAEEVQPGSPAFLGEKTPINHRLDLARWMVGEVNPLVSRVAVNRIWHLFFGRGLVASLEDFGSQGTPPSHPQLLDSLSRRLMDSGWDVKELCREIVLSSTYRQSSVPNNPEWFVTDPINQWLARGPRVRLSAEQIRDLALFASGLLVRKQGGPSVMPYQPAGLWEEAGTGKRYNQASGEGLYRRSLYTYWKRTAPPPSMLTFDATNRETCTAKRELTTTPLQALILLNDPQFVEAARMIAQQLIEPGSNVSLEDRWRGAFRALVGRQPSAEEQQILDELYREQKQFFYAEPANAESLIHVGDSKPGREIDAVDLAAATVVIETLLNYDETQMKR
jgi:hypothetical protein